MKPGTEERRERHVQVEAFEKSQMRQEPPDYFHNLRIVEALLQEAILLGILPLEDPWMGLRWTSGWHG